MPQAGKTTIFEILSGTASSPGRLTTGMAMVPDRRVDALSKLYKPKKTTYGQIQVTDTAGLSQGGGKAAAFLDSIRPVQALIHVIRCFEGDIPHPLGSIDPLRDFNLINSELLLADMALVEKRLERIKSADKIKAPQREQLPVLEKCLEHLLAEQPMRSLKLTEEEAGQLQGLVFFSDKPQLVAANMAENALGTDPAWLTELKQQAENQGWQLIALSARIEAEIAQLAPAERQLFMADLNIGEPAIAALARKAYSLLALISFFTVGRDEVRSWALRQGGTALDAARTIHSDLARGFIRADVYRVDHLLELGSESAVREKGLALLVGKEYTVRDGDVIHIRFNV